MEELKEKKLVKTTIEPLDSNANIIIKVNDESIEIKLNHNKVFQTLANGDTICNSLQPELEKVLKSTLKGCSKKFDMLK